MQVAWSVVWHDAQTAEEASVFEEAERRMYHNADDAEIDVTVERWSEAAAVEGMMWLMLKTLEPVM
eukprot:NODE_21843_length_734_cov_3.555189.p6 GENE.NODE_21843_length_734_cov_3.555189~~NODE_21843_length_734_cov_3.555189.p6  ORF type:complete len:66 (+),score=21.58 NODE_21843_length_734_cov_3.555189:192-389(+)